MIDRTALLRAFASSKSFTEIAKDFGVSRQRISELYKKLCGVNTTRKTGVRIRKSCRYCHEEFPSKVEARNHQKTCPKRSESKFWSHVVKGCGDDCWPWMGGTNPDGYGRFVVKRDGRWQVELTHRYSWYLHNGDIPDGLNVLHTCDHPWCVNPKHLFLGTRADNLQDARDKGRLIPWPGPKLTFEDAQRIRELRSKHSIRELCRMFDIHSTLLWRILTNRSYKQAA